MLLLEEQAKMNWYAYCAARPNHPGIPDEMILEGINRPHWTELPHFKDVVAEVGEPTTGGVWDYYTDLVSSDL